MKGDDEMKLIKKRKKHKDKKNNLPKWLCLNNIIIFIGFMFSFWVIARFIPEIIFILFIICGFVLIFYSMNDDEES